LGFAVVEEQPSPKYLRVWGGAIAGDTPLILRLERGSTAVFRGSEPPREYSVELRRASVLLESARVTFDEDEHSTVSFRAIERAGLSLRVYDGRGFDFNGPLTFSPQPFERQLTYFSGAIRGRLAEPAPIEVRIRDGRFVLGRPGTVEVRRFEPLTRASNMTLEGDGFTVLSPPMVMEYVNTGPQWILFQILPTQSLLSLRIRLEGGLRKGFEFTADVPVESAQYWGQRTGDDFEVHCTLPVTSLYYALVSEQGVWARGRVPLDGKSGQERVARIGSRADMRKVRWLIVGREPTLDGVSAIGWPVSDEIETTKALVTMRDRLLLDGKTITLRRLALEGRQRLYRILVGVICTSLAFLAVVVVQLRRPSREVLAAVSTDEVPIEVPLNARHTGGILLLGIVLGFAALCVWVVMRLAQP
jgi:hypothetical protein